MATTANAAVAPPLLPSESEQFRSSVHYQKEGSATAVLTSHRLLIVTHAAQKLSVAIPLSIIVSHNVSGPKSPSLMMRVGYQSPGTTSEVKYVVLTFVGDGASDERARWKTAIATIQSTNIATNAGQSSRAPTPALSANEQAAAKPAATTPASEPSVAKPAVATAAAAAAAAKLPPSRSAPSPPPLPIVPLAILQLRASLLARNAGLKQLHTDLVDGKMISEDEFWSSPSTQELVRQEQESQLLSQQQRGLSSSAASMTEIFPSQLTSSSLHFKLDANTIHAILLHSPSIHRAYQRLVPSVMSEKVFWTKYFQSKYVQAANQASSSSITQAQTQEEKSLLLSSDAVGDVFSATLESEAKAMEDEHGHVLDASGERRTKALILSKHVDPSIDLTSADADDAVTRGTPSILDHDHSLSSTNASGNNQFSKRTKKAQQQLETIKRFNRHGMLVIDSALHTGTRTHSAAANAVPPSNANADRLTEEISYHSQLNDSLTLTDLQRERKESFVSLPFLDQSQFQQSTQTKRSATPIAKIEDLTGTDDKSSIKVSDDAGESDYDSQTAFNALLTSLESPPSLFTFPSSSQSLSIVTRLSIESRTMNRAAMLTQQINARQHIVGPVTVGDGDDGGETSNDSSMDDNDDFLGSSTFLHHRSLPTPIIFSASDSSEMPIPLAFQTELKSHFLRTQELQRHFFLCFPLNPKSRNKLTRINDALNVNLRRLLLLENDLKKQGLLHFLPLLTPLVHSCEQSLQTYQKQLRQEEKKKQAAPSQIAAPVNSSQRKRAKVG